MILADSDVYTVRLASGEALHVRAFVVEDRMQSPFAIDVVAVSQVADLDVDAIVGGDASFTIQGVGELGAQTWSGVCERVELIRVEDTGMSTYALRIVPALALLGYRRTYRVFQDVSELEAACAVLRDGGVAHEVRCGTHTARRIRVQYAETDLDFVARMLEEAGVTHHFEEREGVSVMILTDAPQRREVSAVLPFVAHPQVKLATRHVTNVRATRRLRPGRHTQSDVDYRRPLHFPLSASAVSGNRIEKRLEDYQHHYGAFLWKGGLVETPHADDRGPARTSEVDGARQVERRLHALRRDADLVRFETNARSLLPGIALRVLDHPTARIGRPLLVSATRIEWEDGAVVRQTCEACFADRDVRPALVTPKPRTLGLESATVTGPAGEEIHTDEMGRVRVLFHWDRAGLPDHTSSCWIPVSQAWAGSGFGAVSIPRVGQEVLVDFLGADPDRPVVMGRVFTTTNPPPYKLPELRMVSGMRSETYPRPRPASGKGGTPPETWGGATGASRPETTDEGPRLELDGSVATRVGESLPSGPVGADAGVAAPPLDLPTLPGPFGANQALLDDLASAVEAVRANGPDGTDVRRCANALMMDDTASAEQLYLQAQKEMAMSVGNNLTGGVGGNRVMSVMGNDTEGVGGYQSVGVQLDRAVAVAGSQVHQVKGDVVLQTLANEVISVEYDTVHENKNGGQVISAKAGIVMLVDSTTSVFMLPDGVVIDAPKVYINPGPVMVGALKGGMSVSEAAALAQQTAHEAQVMHDARRAMTAMEGSFPANDFGPRHYRAYADAHAARMADGDPWAQLDQSVYDDLDSSQLAQLDKIANGLGYTDGAQLTELYEQMADLASMPGAGPQ